MCATCTAAIHPSTVDQAVEAMQAASCPESLTAISRMDSDSTLGGRALMTAGFVLGAI